MRTGDRAAGQKTGDWTQRPGVGWSTKGARVWEATDRESEAGVDQITGGTGTGRTISVGLEELVCSGSMPHMNTVSEPLGDVEDEALDP